MRTLPIIATAAALVLAVALGVAPQREQTAYGESPDQSGDVTKAAAPAASAPLIVHEWGTFTNFSGSDGVNLEFRPLVYNDLPEFVQNRAKQSGRFLGKRYLYALQRMETPVTYFYTPVERDVQVRVEFPQGLLTEFYPPVRHMEPAVDEKTPWFTDETKLDIPLKDSALDWGTVHLIPTSRLAAQVDDPELSRRIGNYVAQQIVPAAGGNPHYGYARDTDSAIVQLRMTDIDYFEKFLFYRGVGNFELPLILSSFEDGRFQLTNSGDQPVQSLFLVTVHGEQIRFATYDGIDAHSELTLQQSSKVSTIEELSEAVVAALMDEQLYEREARAMVRTWQSSWFGEEGTRLFYIVPTEITNALLPLHVEPQPDEMVRVLVGRTEIMSPYDEQQILDLVTRSASAREAAAEAETPFTSPELARLVEMGRLAEPALVRVEQIAKDQPVRDEALLLVRDLRSYYEAQAEAETAAAGG